MFFAGLTLRLQLQISEREGGKGYSSSKRFSFAVVDLDKSETYPLNFVCMLPLKLGGEGKAESTFVNVFENESHNVANQLLLEALERETSAEVKTEIERRMKLLERKPEVEKRCLMCGRIFQAKPKHGFKQKYCPECLKKKMGSRQ